MNSRRSFLQRLGLISAVTAAIPVAAVAVTEEVPKSYIDKSPPSFLLKPYPLTALITWKKEKRDLLGKWEAKCTRSDGISYSIPFQVRVPDVEELSRTQVLTEKGMAMEDAVSLMNDFERFNPQLSKIEWSKISRENLKRRPRVNGSRIKYRGV